MAASIQPFLMFQNRDAEEAMRFYVELFGGTVVSASKYGPEGPGPEGTIIFASFTIAGQTVLCSDSFVKHAFAFTPSSSLFVTCESEAELRRCASALEDRGSVLMPIDSYGFSRLFTWVNDRFGVSWQLTLP